MASAGESAPSTRTVQRALALIEAVASGGGTLSELARTVGLSASTSSRLLATLARHGVVTRSADGRYQPGPALHRLAASMLREDPLTRLAVPHLRDLAQETGESANLAVPSDEHLAVYLSQAPSPQLVRPANWVGRTIPCSGTAVGAALAGRVGRGGYVVCAGAVEPDVTSIAAPLRGADGQIAAAINLLAPTYRTPRLRAGQLGRVLAAHAAELSQCLGAPGPPSVRPGS
jgi:DNA-binding IclR family transcriptional regulator